MVIFAVFVFLLVWLGVWTLGGALWLKWCLNRSATQSLQIALLVVWLSHTGAFAVACVRFGWYDSRVYAFLSYALSGACVLVYRQIRLSRMSADEFLAFLQKQEFIAAQALCTTPFLQDYEDPDAAITACPGRQVASEDSQYNQVVSHTQCEHQGDCENPQSATPIVFGTNHVPGPRIIYSSAVGPRTSGSSTQMQSQRDSAPLPIRLFGGVLLVSTWLPMQIVVASVFAGLL